MDRDPKKPEGQSKPMVERVGDRISLRYSLDSIFPPIVAPGKAPEIQLKNLDMIPFNLVGLTLVIDRTPRWSDDTNSWTADHVIRLGAVIPSFFRYEEVTRDEQGGGESRKIEAIPLDGLKHLDVSPETRRQEVRVRVFSGSENLGDYEVKIQPQGKDKSTDDDRFTLVVSNVPAGQ